MYTLGVNGWIEGIHDPAAALFRDGELIAAVEEERFSRRKHAFDQIPFAAIEHCLAVAGITAGELDHVAVGWDVGLLLSQAARATVRSTREVVLDLFLPLHRFPERRDRAIEVHAIDHHVAHAAFAFAGSPFDTATALIADGSGEYASTMIARLDRGRPAQVLRSYAFRESIGIFYEAVTAFIGFGRFQEGRTMGLAAYGTPRYELGRALDLDAPPPDPLRCGKEADVLAEWARRFEAVTGRDGFQPRRSYDPARATVRAELALCDVQRDLAASAQAWVEHQLCRLARFAVACSGSRNLVLGGGVALNCPANQAIAQLPEIAGVYVPPAPGDMGVALGAACEALARQGVAVRLPRGHVYAGPAFSASVIADELTRTGVRHRERANPEARIAQAIARGQVVAVFRGGLELGPRALGHRSILADPRSTQIRDRVNRIKGREPWRPLAPCVRADAAAAWFEPADSPYMSFGARVTDRAWAEVPGVVHHDGTARLQTVRAADAPLVAPILDAAEAELGIPMVLNTSFNIGAEPIVCSPVDALRAFFASELDVLFLDRFEVAKQELAP
jgi:carbamoyltransferase